jgi:hypothetical protein
MRFDMGRSKGKPDANVHNHRHRSILVNNPRIAISPSHLAGRLNAPTHVVCITFGCAQPDGSDKATPPCTAKIDQFWLSGGPQFLRQAFALRTARIS